MKPQIVSFHCVLKNKLGKIISSTYNRNVITLAAEEGGLLQGLIDGLQDLKEGQKRQIALPADRAYGFYDPKLVMEIPRKRLAKEGIEVGYTILSEDSKGERQQFRVTRVTDETVTLDANHPLAGQDLVFEIEATDVRDATPEELAEPEAPTRKTEFLH